MNLRIDPKYLPLRLANQLNEPIWQAFHKALILLNDGQVEVAIQTLSDSLALIDWKHSETLGLALNIVNFYYQINSLHHGLAFLEITFGYFPESAELYYFQGLFYQKNYLIAAAVLSLQQALNFEQRTPTRFRIVTNSFLAAIYLELGKVQGQIGEFISALVALTKVIELEPENQEIRQALCHTLKISGLGSLELWDYAKKYLAVSDQTQIFQWAEAFYLIDEAQLSLYCLELLGGFAVKAETKVMLLKAKAYLKLKNPIAAAMHLQKLNPSENDYLEFFSYQVITLWLQHNFKKVNLLLEKTSLISYKYFATFEICNLLLTCQKSFRGLIRDFQIKFNSKLKQGFDLKLAVELLQKLVQLKEITLSIKLNLLFNQIIIKDQIVWVKMLLEAELIDLAADSLLTTLNNPKISILKYRLLGEICFKKGLYLEALNLLQIFLEEKEDLDVRFLIFQTISALRQDEFSVLKVAYPPDFISQLGVEINE